MSERRLGTRALIGFVAGIALVGVLLTFAECTSSDDDDGEGVKLTGPTVAPVVVDETNRLAEQARRAEAFRAYIEAYALAVLSDALEREQAAYDEAQRQRVSEATREAVQDRPRASDDPVLAEGEGTCGGNLPPCSVRDRESGGDYGAVNPTGCGGRTCGGAWQFDPRTWDGYGGYARAEDAPANVQDERAAQLWDGGAGCQHWDAC